MSTAVPTRRSSGWASTRSGWSIDWDRLAGVVKSPVAALLDRPDNNNAPVARAPTSARRSCFTLSVFIVEPPELIAFLRNFRGYA